MNSSLLFLEGNVWEANAFHILARRKLTGRTPKIMVKAFFYIKLLYFHFTLFGLCINIIFVVLAFLHFSRA